MPVRFLFWFWYHHRRRYIFSYFVVSVCRKQTTKLIGHKKNEIELNKAWQRN